MDRKNFMLLWARILFVALLISTVIYFALTLVGCEQKEKTIKIGNQATLSGDYEFYGQDQLVSAMLAVDELSPVIIGGFEYEIDLVTKDDEGNAEKAFLVSQEMVEQDVKAIIGSTFNGTTEASIPVYEEYNIPIITPSAQKTALSKISDNFFRLIINNDQKVENIANFISGRVKPQKIILIDNQDEYSVNLVDLLRQMLLEQETNVTDRWSIKVKEQDIDILTENLLIASPDVIFFCGKYDELAYFMNGIREKGVTSLVITETEGMDDQISLLADKQYLEGLIAIVPEPPSLAKYTEDPKAIEFWRKYTDFARKLKEIDIEEPGPFAAYSYDAVYVIIDAMKRANSILPRDYMDELKLTSYDGVTGHIQFDSNGDRVNPGSTIFILKDGTWVRY